METPLFCSSHECFTSDCIFSIHEFRKHCLGHISIRNVLRLFYLGRSRVCHFLKKASQNFMQQENWFPTAFSGRLPSSSFGTSLVGFFECRSAILAFVFRVAGPILHRNRRNFEKFDFFPDYRIFVIFGLFLYAFQRPEKFLSCFPRTA